VNEPLSKLNNIINFHTSGNYLPLLLNECRRIAPYQSTVLIQGESGTGKEMLARYIHKESKRASEPFIAINCAAIPENLIESELFGYKKGAFTDAIRDKRGLLEEAHRGTLLLDEIGELSSLTQVKLLRVLQERKIRRIGEEADVPIDVRLIAATLRDLEQETASGKFREDLYFRLNVITITIKPLRERIDELPGLLSFFLYKFHELHNLPLKHFSKEALKILLEYSWPGNIREVENCVESSLLFSEGETIIPEDLPDKIKYHRKQSINALFNPLFADGKFSLKEKTIQLEKEAIIRALLKTGGNKTQAAKLLEVSYKALDYKMKEYGVGDES
jgi:two-component system, NtrC family, response regulator AtoC